MDLLEAATVPCFVGGAAWQGSSSYEVKDPHSGKLLHTVSSVTVADIPHILEVAQAAFKTWKRTSVESRRAIFARAAVLLKENLAAYAAIETTETTSPAGWSGFDATLACDSLNEIASVVSVALCGEVVPASEDGQRAYIERVPYGTVFGMAPWNAPIVLSQRAVCQPMIAGNAAILKTSEYSPKTQLIIAQVLSDAGLPAGVLSVIHIAPVDAPAVVEAIIAADSVGKVNFTGSTRVGSIIGALCGRYIKPVVLELGGKAPLIICKDADLSTAAQCAMFGAYFNNGQVCMATSTAICHSSIAAKFTELVAAHTPLVKASATDTNGLRGLFNDASAARVGQIVDDALAKGATVAAGTYKIEGNVVQPIMLSNIDSSMRIYTEELFSPVFSMVTFETDEEALEIANSSEYGLAAAIYSQDTANAYKMAREIDSGMVHINGSTIHDNAKMPHGGNKRSGFGRFNGQHGIREYTQLKLITINETHPWPI